MEVRVPSASARCAADGLVSCRQQRDWDAVLSYVKQHELVDPARIAIFGSELPRASCCVHCS